MTARNAMVHRCTIQRDASDDATTHDEWGGDYPQQWANASTVAGVSCFYTYEDSTTSMDGEKNIFATRHMLLLPIGTDVTQDDRIGDIADRRGRVLVEGPLRIDKLGPHGYDHLIAELVNIS